MNAWRSRRDAWDIVSQPLLKKRHWGRAGENVRAIAAVRRSSQRSVRQPGYSVTILGLAAVRAEWHEPCPDTTQEGNGQSATGRRHGG
jgi:hypothetical protein